MGTLSFKSGGVFPLVWAWEPCEGQYHNSIWKSPKKFWWSENNLMVKKKIDGPKTVENNSKAVVAGLRGGKLVHFPTKKNK